MYLIEDANCDLKSEIMLIDDVLYMNRKKEWEVGWQMSMLR